MAAGWKMNFVRMHMDPYWSNTPSSRIIPESDISAFSFDRFKKYLSQVFIPMAQYAASKGMYVVMRPPGVCPDSICVGDAYQQYLIKVWDYVARQPELRNNPAILYELANEPIGIYHADHTRAGDKEMTAYMQPVVDAVRKHCNNIVLVPGLGYQSHYAGYADYPLQGSNIGFAVHCYPGWYNGAHDGSKEVTIDYANFRKSWHEQISTIANIAPVVVTEMDWAPVKYNASFGKSTTGTVGGTGFGANFKQIVDDDGNISWLIFTTPELLARYEEKAATGTADLTVLNDPEACIWPAYHWYQEYATHNYPSDKAYGSTISRGQAVSIQPNHTYQLLLPSSGHNFTITATYEDGSTDNVTGQIDLISSSAAVHALKGRLQGIKEGKSTIEVTYRNANGSTCRTQMQAEVKTFPLHEGIFNPSIWEKGTFDESTGRLQTGRWGFGGWQYNMGIDLSAYHYLIVELKEKQQCSASFRLFDTNNYWTKPAAYNFDNNTRLVIDLQNMKKNEKKAGKLIPGTVSGFYTAGKKEEKSSSFAKFRKDESEDDYFVDDGSFGRFGGGLFGDDYGGGYGGSGYSTNSPFGSKKKSTFGEKRDTYADKYKPNNGLGYGTGNSGGSGKKGFASIFGDKSGGGSLTGGVRPWVTPGAAVESKPYVPLKPRTGSTVNKWW